MQTIDGFLSLRVTHVYSKVKSHLESMRYSKILINTNCIRTIQMFPNGVDIEASDGEYKFKYLGPTHFKEPTCVIQYNNGSKEKYLAFKIEFVEYESWLTQLEGAMHSFTQDIMLVADGEVVKLSSNIY